ncbi:MAG: hypothetical protein E7043_09710 [Lentisphaerae bacterium]|nr:hypothetical protein [Lentisphaerota bacterium]
MKIYIFCDLEGCSGINGTRFTVPAVGDHHRLQLAGRFMAGDINACIEGAVLAGATEIIVRDGHSEGFNVTRDEIDPRADLISGTTPRQRFADIDGSDGLILLGYHGKAGTVGAVLDHTMDTSWQNCWINDRLAGEIAIDAVIAGEHGVPVLMVSGDDKACAEAAQWLPDAVRCEVKKGFHCNGARLPSLEKSRALIKEKTREAIANMGKCKPFQLPHPVSFKVELTERRTPFWDERFRWVDARTWEITGDSLEKLFFAQF